MEKVKVGVIGCGNISEIYLKNLKAFPMIELAACADLDPNRAREKAERFGPVKACAPEELIGDPGLELVVNLTPPAEHARITLAALAAGKHVYTEKPLATSREDGLRILARAREAGLLVGSAPDTFLGGGLQTCRKLLDEGWIGEPVAATAFMTCHGPEGWHPNPDFFYQPGGGPLFDMGPYYLTALVTTLGPVRRVAASCRASFPERIVTRPDAYGARINVETPTHIAGTLDFTCGAVGTIITSFDIWAAELPRLEIYGSEGTLSLPDPNTFGGPVRIRRQGAADWSTIPLTHRYMENSRGLGAADLAQAVRYARPARAGGDLAYHVLDIMQSLLESSSMGRHLELASGCARPASLPMGLLDYELD
ncbi:MAG: Gfo/Idh/MocA family protein [Bacteroidota bacterium]